MTNPTIPSVLAPVLTGHPTTTALIDGNRSITYRDLHHAISVASRHPAFVDRPDEDTPPVTIIAPLGIECTIMQLASMFAGRICAPLEVWMPTDRLVDAIEHVGGPVVCLDHDVATALADVGIEPVECSDLRLERLLAAPASELIPPDGDGDDAAMLLFTSGTVGLPRGVLVTHTLLLQMMAPQDVGPEDVIAITAPPSFVFSTGQTLAPLTLGGTGVFADLSRHSSEQYHEIVATTGVTMVSGTAPLLLEMARCAREGSLDGIRAVHFASQATSGDEVAALRDAFADAILQNSYGSTETGLLTMCRWSPDDQLPGPGPIAAGHPVDGVELTVVDDNGSPVLSGGIGEVVVRLPHPFLGYRNDPLATAAKIVTDKDGKEWIRTGDLGRIDDDRALHLVGRTDDPVKIRGRFINPADIDAILGADRRVAQVTTVAVPIDVPRHLDTFVVPSDPEVGTRELRLRLAQSLPHFALPRRIVMIDEIPTNERGKIDRRALAALRPPGNARSTGAPTLSRSNAEESIVQMFREVLDSDVTIHDDFFESGGDSLAAAELIALFADEFHIELTPAQLVANPTAAKLLDHLDRKRPGVPPNGLVPPDLISLYDSNHPTSLYWVLSGDLGFGTARLSRHTAPLRSWMVREIGTAPGERPLPTIAAMGAHNADVIGHALDGRTIVLGFSIGSVLALETAVVLARRGTAADLLVLIDPPLTELADRLRRPPNPLVRPRKALRFQLDRWSDLHRPGDAIDPRDRSHRFVRRTLQLSKRHRLPVHDGATVIILTEEYVAQGGATIVDESVGHHAERIVIPGTHEKALARPEGLVTALGGLLRRRGLA
ncbi:MAG: AMP-binding protein [Acidimicrobiia bacterium]|nr:AMP-binding protein [Acidimicrobiia bacterium]